MSYFPSLHCTNASLRRSQVLFARRREIRQISWNEAGTRYRYDPSGNLTEKIDPAGMMTRYRWNSLNQLMEVNTGSVITTFTYDPLGRRIAKHSQPVVPRNSNDGSQYHKLETERISREQNLGTTLYGWEGDRLAWESARGKSIHYFYEPNSFIPLAQGIQSRPIKMHKTPDWTNRTYKVKEDPLWTKTLEPEPFQQLLFYHCDQIGTPLMMTDERGEIVWQAQYRAWGEARITAKEGIRNPLRFQGQYFDHETGLHYNRHRYYDPQTGRFISKDPIGLMGGLNLHAYAPNPVEWVDPWGLAPSECSHLLSDIQREKNVLESKRKKIQQINRDIEQNLESNKTRLPVDANPQGYRSPEFSTRSQGYQDAVNTLEADTGTNIYSRTGNFMLDVVWVFKGAPGTFEQQHTKSKLTVEMLRDMYTIQKMEKTFRNNCTGISDLPLDNGA